MENYYSKDVLANDVWDILAGLGLRDTDIDSIWVGRMGDHWDADNYGAILVIKGGPCVMPPKISRQQISALASGLVLWVKYPKFDGPFGRWVICLQKDAIKIGIVKNEDEDRN